MEPRKQDRLRLAVGILCLAVALQVLFGAAPFSRAVDAWGALLAGPSADHALTTIVWQIRMPRALAGALVGIALGAVGAVFQPTFRNALAEPYLLGVSGGAAAGGTAAVAMGLGAAPMLLAAWCGAGLALAGVFALGRERGRLRVDRLLLGGVLLGTVLASITTLIVLTSGGDTNRVLWWLLGSLSPMAWWQVASLVVTTVAGCVWLYRSAPFLNAMALNESTARSLGVPVDQWLRLMLMVSAIMVATTVAFAGLIGFVGLLAPHLARSFVGADARRVIPAAGVIGGILLVVSDSIAQRLVFAVELPVGTLTALGGAFALAYVLRPRRESSS